MPEHISPYALLVASKPKPAPTVVTAYDLYSQAQSAPAQEPAAAAAPAQAVPNAPAGGQPAAAANACARRTHYIADIQSRHNAAVRRTPMRSQPL